MEKINNICKHLGDFIRKNETIKKSQMKILKYKIQFL